MSKTSVLALSLLLLAGCSGANHYVQRATLAINEAVYRTHVAKLASDEFEGRAPGSPGERKTVEYLEQQFLALGLQPVDGASFRQQVPLVEITAVPAQARLGFAGGGRQMDLALGEDMVIGTRRVQPSSAISDSEVVFVGYGVVAPEYGWNDYEGLDMRGKTALILVNDPGYGSGDPGLFRGRAMTYYGRWTYKYEEAARQGAAAAIIIHQTAPAAYPWEVVRNSWTGPQFWAETADGNADALALEAWITEARAREVLAMAGQDLDALQRAALQRGFRGKPLGVTASGSVRNLIRRASSPNVAGYLPGRDRRDEYVIYMAHWDHLGKGLALAGDTIYNGAVDNATGVAGLLAIAAAYRELLLLPSRSVLFLAVTAEESGLIGSEYYARYPLVPLEKTAAVINMDGMQPLGRALDIEVIGSGASELEILLADAAKRQGRVVKPDSRPEHGYFYRSDHFNLAKEGVPSLYTKVGVDLRDRPPGTGQAMLEEYTRERYHKQSDDYDPAWDVSGNIEDLRLLFEVGLQVGAAPSWPNWYEGNEFRAKRDASQQARKP
ncbi:MAG: M28 family metallopeptidase [Steroidobacteraceae bacterium]|jgi:Zn-dependent M28 family amino/carboxypeptidase|nr:M28 family metallopeptidase [Steroidobacteraceae bacterium]